MRVCLWGRPCFLGSFTVSFRPRGGAEPQVGVFLRPTRFAAHPTPRSPRVAGTDEKGVGVTKCTPTVTETASPARERSTGHASVTWQSPGSVPVALQPPA